MILPTVLLEHLQTRAAETAPNECVGLLFGYGERITRTVRLTNASSTPRTRFYAPPQELFAALKEADDRGEVLIGSYHSHPRSPAWPSATDLEAPDGTVMLIVGQKDVKAFRVKNGEAEELELRVV